MRPEPIHLLLLLVVIILVFGASKLPTIAKNLGKSAKVFRDEVKNFHDDEPEQKKLESEKTHDTEVK